MTLDAGGRLGPYEVVSALGAGGMGEVFRARDTRLNREVAIKVLPAAFAEDPERLARFTREAQTLASLNHPNIATIHGIEDVPAADGSGAGSRALVMELVEGEDLSAHLARGPIPIAEALPIARQVAEALEAAHEQGIVHRDLKPANIKVRSDGTVKVLDFGLAKAMEPAGASSSHPQLSHSPTLSRQATVAGVILGTAAYMAPEQAKGKAVDKRADIWAFGVVLHEMLTGRRLFVAEDVSETLAAVLRQEIDFASLPASTPRSVTTLIRRCLVRDPKNRLRDIGDARLALSESDAAEGAVATAPATAPSPRGWRQVLPWALAVGGFGAALVAIALWAPWRTPPAASPTRLLASIGADASMSTNLGASAILSPDGTTLVFAARAAVGARQLFVRKLDQLQAVPLAGTDDAHSPFFSPDGQWIGFFADKKLKKVSVAGGASVSLCDAPNGRGGTWADDDTILFTPTNISAEAARTPVRMMRVPASGGAPSEIGTMAEGAVTHRWPQALPGARAVLYTEHGSGRGFETANVVVAPLAGGAPKTVLRGAYYGRFVPSGHLVYMHEGTLFAVPFDPDRLEVTGPAVPALEGVAANPEGVGGAQLALSSQGTLVYVPAGDARAAFPIHWMARDGKTTVLRAAEAMWGNPRFSPDGQKLALDITDGKQRDIWVYELARDTLTQVTFDPGDDQRPVWTPDGRRIVFSSDRARSGIHNLYWVNADGTGETTRLTESPNFQRAQSWHPGGRLLAFVENRAGSSDLMLLPLEGDATRGLAPGKPAVFLSTPAVESAPEISPDGRWIAYVSTESAGRGEIYVRAFQGGAGKWRISTTGGIHPRWSPTSNELLFENEERILVAPYSVSGGSFRPEKTRLWSPTRHRAVDTQYPFDIHPDGKRLAIRAASEDDRDVVRDEVVFFFGFGDYLKKIAPPKK